MTQPNSVFPLATRTLWLVAVLLCAPTEAQRLTLESAVSEVDQVVYELREDEDRDLAVAYVTDTRDLFYEGAELIDASGLDDEALRRTLTGSFVLYASPHGTARLLRKCIGPLPVAFDEGNVRMGAAGVRATDARLIFVGRHPFVDKPVAVYVGGTNKMVAGINRAPHGPRSYSLHRGLVTVAEGDYRSDYRLSPPSLGLQQAMEDVEQFYTSLERVHPDLLAKLPAGEYLDNKRRTRGHLEGMAESDPDRRVRIKDLARLLHQQAASFGDGHTSLRWPEPADVPPEPTVRYPNAVLEYRNGHFFVAASTEQSIVSKELVAIDGTPVVVALRTVLDHVSGETLPCRVHDFTRRQSFWWWLSEAMDSGDSQSLTVLDEAGAPLIVQLPTLDRATFAALEERARAERSGARRHEGELRFIGDDVACFTYRAFILSDSEKARITDTFATIRARGVQRLVLDMRGNGGGNSAMADHIFSYLHPEPFRVFSKYRVKLSAEALTAEPGLLQYRDLEGMVITWDMTEERPEVPENSYRGAVCLLVDHGTFSSATAFAAMFRDYAVGEIIGYETGGVPTTFGDVLTYSLDHSGIPYGVSYKQFFPPHPRPGDDEHGVIPDVTADEVLLEEFADQTDPVLAFAIARLRGQ